MTQTSTAPKNPILEASEATDAALTRYREANIALGNLRASQRALSEKLASATSAEEHSSMLFEQARLPARIREAVLHVAEEKVLYAQANLALEEAQLSRFNSEPEHGHNADQNRQKLKVWTDSAGAQLAEAERELSNLRASFSLQSSTSYERKI